MACGNSSVGYILKGIWYWESGNPLRLHFVILFCNCVFIVGVGGDSPQSNLFVVVAISEMFLIVEIEG